MSVVDKLKLYSPEALINTAETTRIFIADPTTSAYDRFTYSQLLRMIENEMRERLKNAD